MVNADHASGDTRAMTKAGVGPAFTTDVLVAMTTTRPRHRLGRYWSVEIGCVRVLVLADTGSRLLDLKPHVGCALVDTPPAGFGLNERQPPSSEVIKRVVTHDSLEPRPFVDDLCAQPIFIYIRPECDLALTVEYGVGDEFAYQKLASVKHAGLEPAHGELFEQTTRAT
jgi:hypothetical protein